MTETSNLTVGLPSATAVPAVATPAVAARPAETPSRAAEWPAEARVAHGLAMVYGGKATFPSLTVRESLRAGAYPFHRNRARTETAIGNALVRFPALSTV